MNACGIENLEFFLKKYIIYLTKYNVYILFIYNFLPKDI